MYKGGIYLNKSELTSIQKGKFTILNELNKKKYHLANHAFTHSMQDDIGYNVIGTDGFEPSTDGVKVRQLNSLKSHSYVSYSGEFF